MRVIFAAEPRIVVLRAVLLGAVVTALFARAHVAHACGTSGPGGVEACNLDEHEEGERPKFRVGVSGVYTWTNIHFSDGLQADETRAGVLASLSWFLSRRVSLHLGVGATLGGQLSVSPTPVYFSPGPATDLGVSWRVLDAERALPFVVLTGLVSFEATHTTGDVPYEALDFRLGGVVGWTLAGVVSPFATARAFGGPVYWRDANGSVTGTDASHYQVGAGVAALVAKRVDLFAEGVPLGERAISVGVGVTL
jgi:hypothetical protein